MICKIFKSIKFLVYRNKEFYGLSVSKLGFIPKNKSLIQLAFLHRSASLKSEQGIVLNYERLEFLGDAILGAVVADILYKYFPNKDEGFLTKVRSKIVSRESLNTLSLKLKFDKYVVSKSDISHNKHVYGDVFEAFIGAVYLDQGYQITKKFINRVLFEEYIDIKDIVNIDTNYKSRLLEWGQKKKVSVEFKTHISANSENSFTSVVLIENEIYGQGKGANKKESEQIASRVAIEYLASEYGDYIGDI